MQLPGFCFLNYLVNSCLFVFFLLFSFLRLEKWRQMLQEKQGYGGKPELSCSRTGLLNVGQRKAAFRWAGCWLAAGCLSVVIRHWSSSWVEGNTHFYYNTSEASWFALSFGWNRLFHKKFHDPLAGYLSQKYKALCGIYPCINNAISLHFQKHFHPS